MVSPNLNKLFLLQFWLVECCALTKLKGGALTEIERCSQDIVNSTYLCKFGCIHKCDVEMLDKYMTLLLC